MTTGRPRKTTIDEDNRIVQLAQRDRFINSRNMGAEFGLSQATIRRRFKEGGLNHRIPAKKCALTGRHKTQRLEFASKYLNHNFENVVFVDEKVFCSSACGRLSLWRMGNTRYDERNVLVNNRSGRITLGFWAWMSQAGPGEIVEVGGRLNGQQYKNILSDVLLPTTQVFYPNEKVSFVQDNSSVHNSNIVKTYLANTETKKSLHQIIFPPRSPDLNPIENLWAIMIQRWDNTRARTTEALRRHVLETWDSLRGDVFCYNAVKSMRKRLYDVKTAEGGYTKY